MASKALTCGASPATTLVRKSPSKVVSLSPCNVSFGVCKNPCLRSGNLVLRAQQSSGDIIEGGDLYRVPVQIHKGNTADPNQPSGGERHPQRLPVDVLPDGVVGSFLQILSMRDMVHTMDRLLEETIAAMKDTKGEVVRPRIPLEVKEEENVLKIRLDMPGLSKDDVLVSIEGNNMLVIKGGRKKEGEDNARAETSSYSFFFDTSFELPCAVDKEDDVHAMFKDGVLYISVPKTDIARNIGIE